MLVLGGGWKHCFGHQGSRAGSLYRESTWLPHGSPSQSHQQHGARGTDTAIRTSSQTGMVGPGAVTGEQAGTRGIDELLGAECLLWRAVVGCAVPEAPLLADAVEEGRWKSQAQHGLI